MERRGTCAHILALYRNCLLQGQSDEMAKLFHPGLSCIIGGEKNPGSYTFCIAATWQGIFDKVEYTFAEASDVQEPFPGHLVYKEELRLRSRKSPPIALKGLFEDEMVVDSTGRIVLILRKADPAFFEQLYQLLGASNPFTPPCRKSVFKEFPREIVFTPFASSGNTLDWECEALPRVSRGKEV